MINFAHKHKSIKKTAGFFTDFKELRDTINYNFFITILTIQS